MCDNVVSLNVECVAFRLRRTPAPMMGSASLAVTVLVFSNLVMLGFDTVCHYRRDRCVLFVYLNKTTCVVGLSLRFEAECLCVCLFGFVRMFIGVSSTCMLV